MELAGHKNVQKPPQNENPKPIATWMRLSNPVYLDRRVQDRRECGHDERRSNPKPPVPLRLKYRREPRLLPRVRGSHSCPYESGFFIELPLSPLPACIAPPMYGADDEEVYCDRDEKTLTHVSVNSSYANSFNSDMAHALDPSRTAEHCGSAANLHRLRRLRQLQPLFRGHRSLSHYSASLFQATRDPTTIPATIEPDTHTCHPAGTIRCATSPIGHTSSTTTRSRRTIAASRSNASDARPHGTRDQPVGGFARLVSDGCICLDALRPDFVGRRYSCATR